MFLVRGSGKPKWPWSCLLLIILAMPAAAAAQFSAAMLITDGDKAMPGRIFVQDGKMRQEFSDAEGQTITIVRPDKKVIWFIIPWERTYLEMPLKRKLPGQFIQIPGDAVTKRLAGKEVVNGYETEKYEVAVRGGGGLEKQSVWLAVKLGTPIKMTAADRKFAVEYKSIKEAPQPDRLFELPVGYKKLTSPDLPPSLKGY